MSEYICAHTYVYMRVLEEENEKTEDKTTLVRNVCPIGGRLLDKNG